MRLFILLSRVPWPLEKGDKLRAYNQIIRLAEHHEVHLCCLSDQSVSPEAIEHLQGIVHQLYIFRLNKIKIGWRLLRALFSDRPFQVHYFYQSGTSNSIRRLLETIQPDHIFCQLVRCTEYVKHLHQYSKTLDYMDALNAGLHRRVAQSPWYYRFLVKEEARRMVAYENLIFEYFDHHTIISRQDQQLIYHPQRNRIHIVPNGVDHEFFSPDATIPTYDLVFTGNMSYPPNVESANRLIREILPLLRAQGHKVRVLIAGATPSSEVKALAGPDVHVSGWMDDIRQAYRSARIFIAPMRSGSGLQNKLLEAMSMSLPCITTPIVANALGDGRHQGLTIADDNEGIADAIIGLLNNPDRARELGSQGRALVSKEFNWNTTVEQLEAIFAITKTTI